MSNGEAPRERWRSRFWQVATALVSILLALAVGAGMIAARGHDPFLVYGVLLDETLLQPLGLGQVVFKATTLCFTGLAAAFAFRAGLFNIGGEGQLYLGAFSGAVAGFVLPDWVPPILAIPWVAAFAALGGALAASIPAWLKVARGTHEVISTMMMSFVLLAVVNWLLGFLRVPETVRTHALPSAARLPSLSAFWSELRGSDGNAAALVALVASLFVFYLLLRTRLGYELRAVGLSTRAAEYGGVPVPRRLVQTLLVSGALAGLGGVNFVAGNPGYFEQNFAPYQGYLGIAVALLGRNHPMAVAPAALLFALLSEGGQAIQQFAPKEIGEILQALVILFVVVGARLLALVEARRKVLVGHV